MPTGELRVENGGKTLPGAVVAVAMVGGIVLSALVIATMRGIGDWLVGRKHLPRL